MCISDRVLCWCAPHTTVIHMYVHTKLLSLSSVLTTFYHFLRSYTISMSAFLTLCLHLVNLLQGQVSHATALHFSWSFQQTNLAVFYPHMTTYHHLYIWVKTNQSQFWSHGDFDSILLMEPISSSYSDTLQWKECFIDE